MSRKRKESGTVEIIHSSFIDLLFGAFGAFVFLMIVYVIYTMQLTPKKLKETIDKVTKENQQLQEKLKDYEELKKENKNIKAAIKQVRKENQKLEDQCINLQKNQHELECKIDSLKHEKEGIQKKLDKLKRDKENINKILQDKANLEGKLKEVTKKLIVIKGELDTLKKNKPEKKNTLKEWFKYLFFAIMFIFGSELSQALLALQNQMDNEILAKDDAKLVFDAAKNAWFIQGGKFDTNEKIQANQQVFAILRTILWVSILISAYFFSIKMLHININIFLMFGISAILYVYLRFRFRLLPIK